MADTTLLWKNVERLKDQAIELYADLESDGDLIALNNGLANLAANAEHIRGVVTKVDDALGEL